MHKYWRTAVCPRDSPRREQAAIAFEPPVVPRDLLKRGSGFDKGGDCLTHAHRWNFP